MDIEPALLTNAYGFFIYTFEVELVESTSALISLDNAPVITGLTMPLMICVEAKIKATVVLPVLEAGTEKIWL